MDDKKIITQQPLSISTVNFDIDEGEGGFQPRTYGSGSELKIDVPCHLARLSAVKKLYIRESVAIQQVLVTMNTVDGKYEILDENMTLLYKIPKATNTGCRCCAQWCTCLFYCYLCCCTSCINYFRGWDISDPTGRRPVVHHSTVDAMCWKSVDVKDPESDETFGTVSQCCPIFRPFDNYNVHLKDTKVLDLIGPSCFDLLCIHCCGLLQYSIKDRNGEIVGSIERKSRGQISNSDEFILTFPSNLDVRTKATLMAFTLFIDYKYLENNSCSNICTMMDHMCY